MEKSSVKKYVTFFWIFLIGSFMGFALENILTILKGKYILRQGLIYEPLIPIYGIGLLVFYLIYKKFKENEYSKTHEMLKVFLISFLMGGAIEYLFSLAQEKIFGTISWDYSYLMFNLHGRTSLFHAIFWGICGLIFYRYILPLLVKSQTLFEKRIFKVFTIIFTITVVFDISISFLACERQTERKNGIEPTNSFEVFLDKNYPDEYLSKIYNNSYDVNEKALINKIN